MTPALKTSRRFFFEISPGTLFRIKLYKNAKIFEIIHLKWFIICIRIGKRKKKKKKNFSLILSF